MVFLDLYTSELQMNSKYNFTWIKNNTFQLEWLTGYLKNKIQLNSLAVPFNDFSVKQIEADIRAAKSGEGLELFLKKTRSAWNQYQRRHRMKSSHVTATVELKKDVYKNVVKVAKKYNIPISFAIEELLINSCDFEESNTLKDKQIKRLSLSQQSIQRRRYQQSVNLKQIKSKDISKSELCDKLSLEMLERHQLEMDIIELSSNNNSSKIEDYKTKEIKRYSIDCNEYGVTCVYDE